MNYCDEDYNIAIYKMNLDGSKEEELLKLDTYSTFLNVEGNKILYMDSNDEKGVINLLNGNSKKIVDLYWMESLQSKLRNIAMTFSI